MSKRLKNDYIVLSISDVLKTSLELFLINFLSSLIVKVLIG